MFSQRKIDDIIVGKTLGQGANGKVKKGIKADGTKIALKIFEKDKPGFNPGLIEFWKNEFEKISKLNHPSLVKHFSFNHDAIYSHKNGKDTKVAYIVQELVSGG